jgi:hypothetical protein
VAVTWPAAANLSAQVGFDLWDGSTWLYQAQVNEQKAPADFVDQGATWRSLGSVKATGTQFRVTTWNIATDGQICVDAVRLLPASQPAITVSNGSAGFWKSSSGWITVDEGYNGDALVSSDINGSKNSQAAWWFAVQPGVYDVWATWPTGENLSTTVGYDVYGGSTFLQEVTVNQQAAPTGVTDQGVAWQLLGTYTITQTSLHVSLWNSPIVGSVAADGIRISLESPGPG